MRIPLLAWSLLVYVSVANAGTGSALAEGDKLVEESTLGIPAKAYLKAVRSAAAMFCEAPPSASSRGDSEDSGESSCPVYAKFYSDTIKYVVSQETKAARELTHPKDFVMLNGHTESGDLAKPISVDCEQKTGEGTSIGSKDMEVVGVGYDVSSCDSVQNNASTLKIDSRNKKQCSFYYTCALPLSSYR